MADGVATGVAATGVAADGAADGVAGLVALDRLEGALAEVCGQLNAVWARLVDLAAEALASGAWAQWGIHSPSHWLAWKAGLSRAHARTIVTLAARRDELPVTFAAFARGELSVDQVAPIVAKAPAWADAQVCELAREATVSQLRAVLAGYVFEAPVPAEEDLAPDTPDPAGEYVSLQVTDEGRWRLSGVLDHDRGLVVGAALAEAGDALWRESGAVVSTAEALGEVAQRSLDAVVGVARRDRFRVHLHVDVDAGVVTDGVGRAVPDWMAALVACDTTVTTSVERDGVPIGVGDTRTTVPGVVRRHVLRRDRHTCRVPGCGSRRVEVHHIWHRADGGDHDPANLVAVCARHHRMHHRGGLGISGNAEAPGGLHVTDPWGRPLRAAPVARPPTRPPPPVGPYLHPSGERLDHRAVTFTPPTPGRA